MDRDVAKKEILDLVQKNFKSINPPAKFVAGETYISVAPSTPGCYTANDLVSLVGASLDLHVTEGKLVSKFEREISRYLGVRHAVMCNSGSSANLLAMSALTSPLLGSRALQPGDEVITVAVGFPTTVNPIIQIGCVPVFVDINIGTYNPHPWRIENAITEKTKAIFIAHTLGNLWNLDVIKGIATDNHLWLIEDSCDALGGTWNGQMAGSFGDISTLSMYPAHHLSVGEAGVVFTDSPILNKIIRSFRDWGRECFPSGTLINTRERQIPIEKIKVGDAVLSHTGETRCVTEVMSRDYAGNLYTIKPFNGVEVTCTELHPFYVKRTTGAFDWVFARDLKKTDLLVEALPRVIEGSEQNSIGYTYATAYKNEVVDLPITSDLLRLVGYWLAEGSLASGKKGKSGYNCASYLFHRVDFSFNKSEAPYIEDVCFLMKEIFGVTGNLRISKLGNQQGASLTFKSRKAFEFFMQFFGKGAENKSIPAWILNLPLGLTRHLIVGYWRGDGSSSKAGYSFCSVSPHLLNQIRRLLGMNGIMASYCLRTVESHTPSTVNNKKVVAKHNAHWLNIYGESALLLSKVLEEDEYKLGAKKNKSFTDLEYIYYPIDSITVNMVSHFEVYNLEVDVDHSYHANNVAVHNCWCQPGHDNTCGKRFSQKGRGDLPDNYDHKYVYSHIGYNLKSTDLQASLALSQFKKLPEFVQDRKDNWDYLSQALGKFEKWFILPERLESADPSWFGFVLTVRPDCPFTRNDLTSYLEEHKIGTRNLFAGNLTRQPAYKGKNWRIADEIGGLPNSDKVMASTFWIGVHPQLTKKMLDYMIKTIEEFLQQYE